MQNGKMSHYDGDRDMYRMYSRMYDIYRCELESTKELIESKQHLYNAMMITREWSELELEVLTRSYDITKDLFHQAELNLDFMKEVLDIYYQII